MAVIDRPHAVCLPFPAQGHINPMLKLAKLLHFKGFHITFVNTEYNHRRLLKSIGHHALQSFSDFRFETIPDGLPPSDDNNNDVTQNTVSLSFSISNNCLTPLLDLIHMLNGDASSAQALPQVTCIVADLGMAFSVEAAEELGLPVVILSTTSACGTLAYAHSKNLVARGLIPIKDKSCLETTIDCIPSLKGIQLKYLPSFLVTTEPNDMLLHHLHKQLDRATRAIAVIDNTFDTFEQDVLNDLSALYPRRYALGPLHLFVDQVTDNKLKYFGLSLWKEKTECIEWLDSQELKSVVYVNFGSITIMTPDQLTEFAWGLANSKRPFLWIMRPDLVAGDSAVLPHAFVFETKDRGLLAGWCPQEQVLKHPSIGGFLSHMGWNSTLESVSAGVPMLCWPYFAEQQTNCWFACNVWGIGMEIDGNVKRDKVESLVRELMEGEKGRELKNKAVKWKAKAAAATEPGGSSYQNLDKLLGILLGNKEN